MLEIRCTIRAFVNTKMAKTDMDFFFHTVCFVKRNHLVDSFGVLGKEVCGWRAIPMEAFMIRIFDNLHRVVE